MSKRYCTKCGTELPDDAEFCPKCGEPVKPDDEEEDLYEEEAESKHSGKTIGIIIAVIVVAAVCIGAGFFLLSSRQDAAANETADQQETSTNEKKEKAEDSSSEETDDSDEAEDTTTTSKSDEKSDVLESTDNNAQTVPATKTGTVFISPDVTGPRRIKVRTGPSFSAGDTGARAYDGDRVTVYETKFAEGYSWYRIGDNQWIRGDDENFGANFDH